MLSTRPVVLCLLVHCSLAVNPYARLWQRISDGYNKGLRPVRNVSDVTKVMVQLTPLSLQEVVSA